MSDSWIDPQFAEDYMHNAADTDTNWYEHAVNLDSLLSLIPENAKSLLDFGCGPGDFTAQLQEKGYEVDGCDASAAMIDLARQHFQHIDFFVWDGMSAYSKSRLYDVIISKLTLHFIEDLAALATMFASILHDNGSLLISVPHPIPTMPKANGAYLKQAHYDTEIGTYGMRATMIHRSFQDYINPFLKHGFVLIGIIEPSIPPEIVKKYHVSKEYAGLPRRLNVSFRRVVNSKRRALEHD